MAGSFLVLNAAATPIQSDQSAIRYISRNSLFVHLLDGVLHRHQVAAR
jgi:hypothetical protein